MKKNTTSKDVAKMAGVSQSMVSLVLNDVKGKKIRPETRKKVIDAANFLNYRIDTKAKGLKTNKANTIGLLSAWDKNSFVFPPSVEGISKFCKEKNQALILCNKSIEKSKEYDFVEYYLEGRIDGLIYIGEVSFKENDVIYELKKNKIPFVNMIGAKNFKDVIQVDIDFFMNAKIATMHAFEKGYKRIIYPVHSQRMLYAQRQRRDGVLKVCSNKDMEFLEVKEFDIRKFKKSKIKTCYISTSYGCFNVLKKAYIENIKVPKDIGVISLDNEIYAPYLFPPLTTVDEPFEEMAYLSANILFKLINDKKVNRINTLKPILNIRKSC